jgi:serine/threonine-protein kinase
MSNNGVDNAERDQRLSEVLVACLEAIDQGRRLDPQEWLARYPEFAPELARLIEGQELLGRLTGPLCASWRAAVDTPVGDQTPPPGDAAIGRAGFRLAGLTGVFGDYELLRELGSGGMGVVYEARQRSLQRIVALKMLRTDRLVSAADRQRFQAEAEAVAALDHPHLVPIYEVGELEGQTYFTMKLVNGGNLAQRLQDFLADDRAAAQLLVQFARAVHHAHQRGVLHRDLKPSNILLDSDGLPYVTDFGLAKRLESGADLTQSGAIVGTPGFMAPEQAAGKKGTVTTAADVYGLGAVLYALLTGRPPFTGETPLDTLTKVRDQEAEPPSKNNPRVHRDLEAICLKCLDKEPRRRYASAEALAEDLERWLGGEPIQARRLSRPVRLARWGWRHKPLVAAAAALLAVVLVGGATLWGWQQQRAATEQAVGEDLQRAEFLEEQERWPEALQVLERARGRLAGTGPAYLRERVERQQQEVALVARLEEAYLQVMAISDGERDFAGSDRAYRNAFAEYGLDPDTMVPEEVAGRIRASAIRYHLVAALDTWAWVKGRLRADGSNSLRAVARLADDDPWRARLRNRQRQDRMELERLAGEEGALAQPRAYLQILAQNLVEVNAQAVAVRLLRRAQLHNPADSGINHTLADFLNLERATKAEAVGFYRVALALRPKSPVLYNSLGISLTQQGKLAEEVEVFHKAIELGPNYAKAHCNLGAALLRQGQLTEAEDFCRQAIALKHDFAGAYTNLGIVLAEQGRLPEAVDAHRKAIALKHDFAYAYNALGNVLRQQRKLSEAVEALRKAIAFKPNFAEAHNNLARVWGDLGKWAEEEGLSRQAITLESDYAAAHVSLCCALYHQGRLPEAEAAGRKAVALEPNDAEAYYNLGISLLNQNKMPDAEGAGRKAVTLKPGFAEAHCLLGLALSDQGKFAEALQELKEGHRLGSQNPRWRYPSAQWLRETELLPELDAKLTQVLNGSARPANAAECLGLARLCHQHKKLHAAAARFFQEAFAAQPKLAEDPCPGHRYNAACAAALAGCGQGADVDTLDTTARAGLREQALDWLRADLAAWHKVLEGDRSKAAPAVRQKMQHWLQDADFAGVRGPQALAKLSEAERCEWEKLWQEVERLLESAKGRK